MALAAGIAIADGNATWQAARAQAIVQVQARVIATNIPGASAISQVGTFLLNTPPLVMCNATVPFPSPIRTSFASFIQTDAVLDPNRILVGSRSNFGAPLAMEGLAAFFLESTFLGLWIFGWDRLPKRVHLACIWIVALGSALSAAFIMAANSWMQHPVGYTINQKTGQAQLNNIGAVFTNPVFVWGYLHVLLASAVTGAVWWWVRSVLSAWPLEAAALRAAGTGSQGALAGRLGPKMSGRSRQAWRATQ